jgi:hypothetical protein
MPTAKGTFDVALVMLPVENVTDADMIQRRSIDKKFHGALEGSSKGQMLSIGTTTAGSAVYVAVERVEGRLDGKAGGFSLHHTGVMNRGTPSLAVTVVADSGTGDLTGITGTLAIDIKEKQHFYTLDYTLPSP